MLKLGMQVKHIYSGYKGVVAARSEFLCGCVRVRVDALKLREDGKPLTDLWFDEAEFREIPGSKMIEPAFHVGPIPEEEVSSSRRRVGTGGPTRESGMSRADAAR